jgi:hypothetical protein
LCRRTRTLASVAPRVDKRPAFDQMLKDAMRRRFERHLDHGFAEGVGAVDGLLIAVQTHAGCISDQACRWTSTCTRLSFWRTRKRGGRVGLNSVSAAIDGCAANYLHQLPLWGVAQEGLARSEAMPHNDGQHSCSAPESLALMFDLRRQCAATAWLLHL